MNESEKRRRELLEETRRRYSDSRMPPAVHPRYSAVYSQLYREEGRTETDRSLGLRFFLAVLLFVLFLAADRDSFAAKRADTGRIAARIEQPADSEIVERLRQAVLKLPQIVLKE